MKVTKEEKARLVSKGKQAIKSRPGLTRLIANQAKKEK